LQFPGYRFLIKDIITRHLLFWVKSIEKFLKGSGQ
jgi:hypothetical protein